MKRLPEWMVAFVLVVAAGAAVGCSDTMEDPVPTVEPEWSAEEDGPSGDRGEDETSSEPLATGTNEPGPDRHLRDDGPVPDGVFEEALASRFVAHEWGTFTSVVDSDGRYLPGLHHQGVALPSFVHDLRFSGPGPNSARNPDPRGPSLPEPVTQKLETPVIYFYTDEPRDVRVEVDFPKGYITKWYPDSIRQNPTEPSCTRCTNLDRERYGLDELADGRMVWDVSITNDDRRSQMPSVPPEDIWAPSRRVPDAAYVQHRGETDKFVFYRGVGRSEPPLTIEAAKTQDGPEFTFTNHSPQRIPEIYLMHIEENRGRITKLSSLEGGASKTHNPAPKEMPKEQFVRKAKRIVESGLAETGLTRDEAEAMVETWAHSYFRATGHRVLYVLPRKWTDRMLPLEIEPEPDRLVRTLVGRVEVMTPTVERETLKRIREAWSNDRRLEDVYRGGRFEEPHFRRACELASKQALKSWCETQLERLSAEVISEDGRSGY